MTLSLSDLTAENSLVPGSEDGKETLSGDDGLQVSLAVTAGGGAAAPTLLCHKVARSSFDVEVANAAAAAVVIVGDWNVEKPAAELLIW